MQSRGHRSRGSLNLSGMATLGTASRRYGILIPKGCIGFFRALTLRQRMGTVFRVRGCIWFHDAGRRRIVSGFCGAGGTSDSDNASNSFTWGSGTSHHGKHTIVRCGRAGRFVSPKNTLPSFSAFSSGSRAGEYDHTMPIFPIGFL